MTKRQMTLIYYHVPEDKDDPECPNVYGVPASKHQITLAIIHQSFPLKGSYLFRFKQDHQGNQVWLDLPDPQSKIPLYKDRVIMKATRVSWQESKLHSQYHEKNIKASQGAQKHPQIDFFDHNEAKSNSPYPQTHKVEHNKISETNEVKNQIDQFNLLDDHHHQNNQNTKEEGKKDEDWLHGFGNKGSDLI